MRTKALLGLAALAASALGASAANVYSLNVVGYINVPLSEKFNVIGLQLDLDGTGLNNVVSGVFSSNLPVNSKVYTYNGASFGSASVYSAGKGGGPPSWVGDQPLNPGQAAFVSIPVGAYGGAASNVTVVGNVLQGSLANQFLPAGGGFGFVSSKVPLSGTLQTNLLYTPQTGDKVYKWNLAGQTWGSAYIYAAGKGGGPSSWVPQDPPVAIAEGFWLDATNAPSAAHWTQNFTVQ
jgi:hypothetical protein